MSQLVPTIRTTPTSSEFARAALEVYPEFTQEGVGVLWAHFAGETGSGKNCWNWNLGNAKWFRGCPRNYVALAGVWEGFANDRVEEAMHSGLWVTDPSVDHAKAVGPGKTSLLATKANPARWFQAFDSLDEGMRYFVETKQRGRYAEAWTHLVAGDPEEYARVLKACGYYTASVTVYAASMRRLFDAWMKTPSFEDAQRAIAATCGEEPT